MPVWDTPVWDTMLLAMPVSLPLPLWTSPELLLLLSPLSEELTPELDVTSQTLLEPSTSPRGRLRLMPTTWEDTEPDTPVWDTLDSDTLDSDTPVWDTLDSGTPVSDTPVWDTMLLATPVSLPLPLLLSPPSEDFTPELDVISPTLLEPSTLPENQIEQFHYVFIEMTF